jgi:DNA-binding response OmpR family regulator
MRGACPASTLFTPSERVMARVLIVDDEPDLAEALELHLKYAGYETVAASSGEEALRKVTAERPHVILLDIRMPDMDGLEVLRRVREIAPQVAVIMVTAVRDEQVRREALDTGAADFITKPIDLAYLSRSLSAVLGRMRI